MLNTCNKNKFYFIFNCINILYLNEMNNFMNLLVYLNHFIHTLNHPKPCNSLVIILNWMTTDRTPAPPSLTGNFWINRTLKRVFAKNEMGYRLTAKKYRWWSLLILVLSVASVRRKLLNTTYTEERSVHTNSENCNIQHG